MFFSDLAPSTCASTRSTRLSLMRDVATLLEALPYIREFHGKTVVIKYGGAAMTDPALKDRVRARRDAAQVRGHEPGDRARRRPGDHRLHGAARPAGAVRRRPAGVRRRRPSRWRRWCSSARSTRTSCCCSAGTASPRSGCAATTGCCSAPAARRRRAAQDIGFVGRIDHVDVGVLHHIAQDYVPVIASRRRRPRGPLVQHQRRRGRGRGGRGARRLQGHLPDRRRRLAARPGRPGLVISRASAAEVRDAARRPSPAACARSSPPAWRRSTAASARRTSSTAGCRIRCCSSCSPTPARAR